MDSKRLGIAFIIILLFLVSCTAPPAPQFVVDRRGVGTGGACAILDGSIGYEAGPFPDQQFPRLKASNGNYNTADANYGLLGQLALLTLSKWLAVGHSGMTTAVQA